MDIDTVRYATDAVFWGFLIYFVASLVTFFFRAIRDDNHHQEVTRSINS